MNRRYRHQVLACCALLVVGGAASSTGAAPFGGDGVSFVADLPVGDGPVSWTGTSTGSAVGRLEVSFVSGGSTSAVVACENRRWEPGWELGNGGPPTRRLRVTGFTGADRVPDSVVLDLTIVQPLLIEGVLGRGLVPPGRYTLRSSSLPSTSDRQGDEWPERALRLANWDSRLPVVVTDPTSIKPKGLPRSVMAPLLERKGRKETAHALDEKRWERRLYFAHDKLTRMLIEKHLPDRSTTARSEDMLLAWERALRGGDIPFDEGAYVKLGVYPNSIEIRNRVCHLKKLKDIREGSGGDLLFGLYGRRDRSSDDRVDAGVMAEASEVYSVAPEAGSSEVGQSQRSPIRSWQVRPERDRGVKAFVGRVVDAVDRDDVAALEGLTSEGLIGAMDGPQRQAFRDFYLRALSRRRVGSGWTFAVDDFDPERREELAEDWSAEWPVTPEFEIWIEAEDGTKYRLLAREDGGGWGLVLPVPGKRVMGALADDGNGEHTQ